MLKPIYFRDILKSWKNRDIQLFKQHIHKLPPKQVRLVIKVLEKKSARLLQEENFEYAKILLEWIKINHKKYALNWGIIEKKLIFNRANPHLKEKNVLYLQLCELFLESKYIENLPMAFAQYWPEGWAEFTQRNIDKMSDQVKKNYLFKTCLYITPEFNVQIEKILEKSLIENTLSQRSIIMGSNYFWASDKPHFQRFKDEQTLYLLQWSENLGFTIESNMNIIDYCSQEWQATFAYLVKQLGKINFQEKVMPQLEKKFPEIEVFKTWLTYYGLQNGLIDKPDNEKSRKI
jgi:hypothetical protein